MKAPLNVPAINNEFEVLAIFLGIADEDEQGRSQIVACESLGRISNFEYHGAAFAVSRQEFLPGANAVFEFNSNWYSIQQRPLVL